MLIFPLVRAPTSLSVIEFVGAVANSAADGNNTTLDLSGLGLLENDVVVIIGGISGQDGGSSHNPGVSSAGWTEVYDEDHADNTRFSFSINWKVMGASPDSSAACRGGAGAGSDACAYVALAFRNVDTTTPLDTTSQVTESSGASTNPNPPSISPVTGGCAIIAAAGGNVADTTITAPSGYAALSQNVNFDVGSDTNPYTAAATYILKTRNDSAPENPAAFTTWSSGLYFAATIALRPAT